MKLYSQKSLLVALLITSQQMNGAITRELNREIGRAKAKEVESKLGAAKDYLKEKASQTKAELNKGLEKTKEGLEKATQKTKSIAQNTADTAKAGAQKTKEVADNAYGTASEKVGAAKDKVVELADKSTRAAQQIWEDFKGIPRKKSCRYRNNRSRR